MSTRIRKATEFVADEEGPTATEYAIMLALIIVVAIGAIRIFGGGLSDTFDRVCGGLFG